MRRDICSVDECTAVATAHVLLGGPLLRVVAPRCDAHRPGGADRPEPVAAKGPGRG